MTPWCPFTPRQSPNLVWIWLPGASGALVALRNPERRWQSRVQAGPGGGGPLAGAGEGARSVGPRVAAGTRGKVPALPPCWADPLFTLRRVCGLEALPPQLA